MGIAGGVTHTMSQRREDVEAEVARARRARTWRRVGTGALLAVVVAGVAGVYGPRETRAEVDSDWGTLEVTYPQVLRAGVALEVAVEVSPATPGEPYALAVDLDWVRELGVEAVFPEPSSHSSVDGTWVLTYDESPGETVVLTGRVPTHPVVGPRTTTVAVTGDPAPGRSGSPDAELETTTWVLP